MKKVVLKYGLIGSMIGILLTVVTYVIGYRPVLNGLIQLISFVAFIFIGIYAAREYRKDHEGRISFKEAFLAPFLSLVAVTIISALFSLLLFNYIDPTYRERQTNAVIEKFESNENIPDEQKEKIRERIEKQTKVTPAKQLIYFGAGIAFVAVISLIIGASVKKDINEPTQI